MEERESQALTIREEQPLTAAQIKDQVGLIQAVMKGVMKKGEHYGTIPGCGNKPSLFKAGAEKLMLTFRIAPELLIEDLSDMNCVRYRVTARAISIRTGAFLGSGIGECSSDEEKYKWRVAVHENEWKAAGEELRRLKFYKDGSRLPQVRCSPADVANTILKMAKKRAVVDMTLTVTGASDIFTQDVEDMTETGIVDSKQVSVKPPIQQPQSKSQTTQQPIVPGNGDVPACPKCGGETSLVPAGTSRKTNKPYLAFWSCKDRGCGGTVPDKQWQEYLDKKAREVHQEVPPEREPGDEPTGDELFGGG